MIQELQLAPCARCAQVQRTCCQRAEILLTEGDVARIEAHVGSPAASFVDRRRPADPAYLEPDEDDPHWLEWTVAADGTRRMLRRMPSGACSFLGQQGCVLPTEVRPLVCRLYPFAYDERGLAGREEDYCPTDLLAPDGRAMHDVLGISAVDAERWRAALYRELRDGRP